MTINEFIEEVRKLGIEVTDEKIEKLEKYYSLLIEYNKFMNLTGITEHDEVYLKHFYDSLTIVKAINLNDEKSLCDLGSGAGFPGIVIKIFFPNLSVTLVDSLNKRIKFLNEVIDKLQLENIEAIHERIEDYSLKNNEKYDIVTARAVAPLNILLELGIRLNKVGKYFIAMKGNLESEPNFENALSKLKCKKLDVIKFKLPKENSNRSLVKIEKENHTPELFPRKYKEIKKEPL